MPLWTMTDLANGAPKFNVFTSNFAANGSQAYQNVTISAMHANVSQGVFGVDTNEKANVTFEGPKMTHSGWVSRREGTGYVKSIAVTNGGTGYTPGSGFITFVGGGAGSGANAIFQVNAAGSIANVTINVASAIQSGGGSNYNVAPTANAVVAFTTPAVLVVTTGGRVGRREYITLVASGSMSRDANTDDAIVGG
jgi:hypothetical protein